MRSSKQSVVRNDEARDSSGRFTTSAHTRCPTRAWSVTSPNGSFVTRMTLSSSHAPQPGSFGSRPARRDSSLIRLTWASTRTPSPMPTHERAWELARPLRSSGSWANSGPIRGFQSSSRRSPSTAGLMRMLNSCSAGESVIRTKPPWMSSLRPSGESSDPTAESRTRTFSVGFARATSWCFLTAGYSTRAVCFSAPHSHAHASSPAPRRWSTNGGAQEWIEFYDPESDPVTSIAGAMKRISARLPHARAAARAFAEGNTPQMMSLRYSELIGLRSPSTPCTKRSKGGLHRTPQR